MKTAIIVDSTAYLSKDLRNHPDFYQVTLSLVFEDGKVFMDTAHEADHRDFFRYLSQSASLPKTSQPQPGTYYQLIDQLIEKGYDSVVAIHLSSGISGTYQTACVIAQDYQGKIDIRVIDARSSCIVIETLARQALDLVEDNFSLDQIVQSLTWLREETITYLMVENLDNLVKGGRVSPSAATVGQLLKIRPVLMFTQEGEIVLYKKIRTNRKVYQHWLDLAHELESKYPQGFKILLTHANAPDEIEELTSMIRNDFPDIDLYINHIGPVIGTHTGEGSVGLALMPNLTHQENL